MEFAIAFLVLGLFLCNLAPNERHDEQSPLLKAAALYFDKLFILDPLKASWATIGPGERESDLLLLESEGILQRIE